MISPRTLLRIYGIRPKKGLSQNFLGSADVLTRIADFACLEPGDTVVEVGPGLGALTGILAERVGKVVAIEADRALADVLSKNIFAAKENVVVLHHDALAFDFRGLVSRASPSLKVVSNLPFHIGAQLIFHLLDAKEVISSLTLMLQKEVAERIAAAPGSKRYGYVSVFCQYHCRVHMGFTVERHLFHPRPKVDGAVIRLEPFETPPVDVGDERFFFSVVKASFAYRRKTLPNSLKSAASIVGNTDAVRAALAACAIDPRRRAETLSLEDFAALAGALARG